MFGKRNWTADLDATNMHKAMEKPVRMRAGLAEAISAAMLIAASAAALRAEKPYFLTYDHQLEEPGELEISLNPVIGVSRSSSPFVSSTTELEYGVKGWWTTEFYLDGQSTPRDSTIFTGFRWENRFRPLAGEHWINPIIYLEYEHINGADKSMLEVVGFDSEEDHAKPNSDTRREREREIETKLILSSNHKGWNISENFIAEKNLTNGPWEFGYALGASRPMALAASPQRCSFCRENFTAGVEFYGGLGTWNAFGLAGASHYVAPVVAWNLPNGTTFRISPGFGLTDTSHPFLLRLGVSYEVPQFGQRLRKMFR